MKKWQSELAEESRSNIRGYPLPRSKKKEDPEWPIMASGISFIILFILNPGVFLEGREIHLIVSRSCYLCIAKTFRDCRTSSLQGGVGAYEVRSEQVRDGQWSANEEGECHREAATASYSGLIRKMCITLESPYHHSGTTLPSNPTPSFPRMDLFRLWCYVGEVNQEGWVPLAQVLISQIIYRKTWNTSKQTSYWEVRVFKKRRAAGHGGARL